MKRESTAVQQTLIDSKWTYLDLDYYIDLTRLVMRRESLKQAIESQASYSRNSLGVDGRTHDAQLKRETRPF